MTKETAIQLITNWCISQESLQERKHAFEFQLQSNVFKCGNIKSEDNGVIVFMVRLLKFQSDAVIDLYKGQTFVDEPHQEAISINYDEYLELRNAYVKGFENINTIL